MAERGKLPPLHLDFETRSKVNLTSAGSHVYAADPSTEILLMAWAFGDGGVHLWDAEPCGEPWPAEVSGHILAGGELHAFNAQFERLIVEYVAANDHGCPVPRADQWRCTAAQCRANNLPGSLAMAARFLGRVQKMDAGTTLIKTFCVPRGDGGFNTSADRPGDWKLFKEYCIRDVEAERELANSLRPLTPREIDDFIVNERINDRGIHVDAAFARAAAPYGQAEQDRLGEAVDKLTGGDVLKPRSPRLAAWVYERLDDHLRWIMEKPDGKGGVKLTLAKDTRAALLEFSDTAGEVREAVELADGAQASSVAKLSQMAGRADPEDSRVRGAFLFCGAGATGRYSSRGLQAHNMPRDSLDPKRAKAVRRLVRAGRRAPEVEAAMGVNLLRGFKGMIRSSITAPKGRVLVWGDLSQIEGRTNPWLADSHMGREKVQAYVDGDVYAQTAADLLGKAPGRVTAWERQAYGKVPELSLGFGGGANAFKGMAKNYGLSLPENTLWDIVRRWRRDNKWAVDFWGDLSAAAHRAVRDPGTAHPAGRVAYLGQGDSLWCLLPDGGLLHYPLAEIAWNRKRKEYSLVTAKASWTPGAGEEWPRIALWPGLLCENVVQATAARILRDALRELDRLGVETVLHSHDEVVAECDKADAPAVEAVIYKVLTTAPAWAGGLPLGAETGCGKRYGK